MGNWIIDSLDSFKNESFIHKRITAVFEWRCAGTLFETISVDEIEQNKAIVL